MSSVNRMTGNVMTAVATAAVLAALGWAGGVFEKGASAISEDQIKEVIKETLITDAGRTYAATLVDINTRLATISTQIAGLKEDVNDLEDSVLELARE